MGAIKARKPTPRHSLELLYNISRELASALDLRTVLQRILFLSMGNVGAANGSIIVLDKKGHPTESAIITGETLHDQTTAQLSIIYERGLAGWVATHKEAVLIPNTSLDDRWLKRPDDSKKRSSKKSAVSVPILARKRLVGVMTLVQLSPGFFKPEHLDLLRAIADQAGIAVLNAQLYAESQRQARAMTALANSSTVITGSLNLDNVLESILKQVSRALRVDIVSLALIDAPKDELVFHASSGKKSQNIVGIRLKLGQGIAGWVAKEGQGIVVLDVNQDSRFFPAIDQQTGFKTRAIACAPIRWHGQVIGILEALNPRTNQFDPDALLVLTGIGSLAGSAIRHAQLFESLQAAHQRYHDLFEDSIDPILITNSTGYIIEGNRQAELITGAGNSWLQKTTVAQLNVVNEKAVGREYEILTSGETISYEAMLKTRSGRLVPVHVYARKVEIEDNSYLQWILHDISERKNLESLRNDLISMIYHDIRSPLANVVSSLDVLESMLPLESDPALQSLFDIAVRSTERIQRLTSSLLDMQRLETGHPITNPQPVSPLSLVRDAVEAIQSTAEMKKQTVRFDISTNLAEVSADSDMIKRVLINILENAVKYTPMDSRITIDAEQHDREVEFCIQDTGPGIPDSERQAVFDKFSRLHTSENQRGYGLGLAYCRLAVEAHGGRIWVESEPGSGACFKFTLPSLLTQTLKPE